jgi:hypothetical protein
MVRSGGIYPFGSFGPAAVGHGSVIPGHHQSPEPPQIHGCQRAPVDVIASGLTTVTEPSAA